MIDRAGDADKFQANPWMTSEGVVRGALQSRRGSAEPRKAKLKPGALEDRRHAPPCTQMREHTKGTTGAPDPKHPHGSRAAAQKHALKPAFRIRVEDAGAAARLQPAQAARLG